MTDFPTLYALPQDEDAGAVSATLVPYMPHPNGRRQCYMVALKYRDDGEAKALLLSPHEAVELGHALIDAAYDAPVDE